MWVVLKNLLTLGAGELLARAAHAAAFLLLARALGPGALGQLGFAAAVTSYASILVTQGFDTIALREVSRAPGELKRYVEHIIGARLLLATGAGAATSAVVWLAGLDATVSRLMLVLAVSFVANALTPRWSFLALERSQPLALAGLIAQAFLLVAALLIRSPAQVLWAAGAQVAGELAAAIFLVGMLTVHCGPLRARFSRVFTASVIRQSWPLTLSLLMGNVLYNFDVVALAALGRSAEIGIYAACYRCVTVFSPLLIAFQSTVFPMLARGYPDYETIRAPVRRLTLSAVLVFAAAALPVAFFARPLLIVLFGHDYADGAVILRILIWALPIQGFCALSRRLLIAFHQPRADMRNVSYAVLTNVGLVLALIPSLGAVGCAIATVSSEFVLAAVSELVVRRRITRPPA